LDLLSSTGLFLPIRVLARLFGRLFLQYLKTAFNSGRLEFFASLQPLRDRRTFLRFLMPARMTEWVVYAKPPMAGPKQVLEYLSRYTDRVAISNSRIVGIDDGTVRFRWKNYRAGGRVKMITLAADDFIRRFLLHVLPDGFQRIRHYGFLANRSRQQKLDRCRQVLAMPEPEAPACEGGDYRDCYQQLTGQSLKTCPACGHGHMVLRETFGPSKSGSTVCDT
jgi:hypothetical protein